MIETGGEEKPVNPNLSWFFLLSAEAEQSDCFVWLGSLIFGYNKKTEPELQGMIFCL